jgi:hypothetical protein
MAQRELLDFLERHATSQSPYLAEARAALQMADSESSASPSTAKCAELLSTYSVRARHLKTIQSAHAEQLQREVAALCITLDRASAHAARIFSVTLAAGRSLIFFEDAETLELLGALASYDARKLSDEDWYRVWGHGRSR